MSTTDAGIRQLKNGNWAYRFSISVNGQKISQRGSTNSEGQPLKTKTDAIRARKKAIKLAQLAPLLPVKEKEPEKLTVAQVFDEYREKGRSDRAYDAISNTLTMTAAFAKKASQLNTHEYYIVRQLRNDNPGMKIEKSAAKAPANRPLNITFAKMEEFIKQCRDSKDRLEAFKKVKSLSKIQASPYKYVKTWFLNNYANYSEQPEFDADGFVVVKTKSQMEAEKKAAAEAQEQSFEDVMAEAKAQFEETAA